MSLFSDVVLAEASLQSYFRLAEAAGTFADSKGALVGTATTGVTRSAAALDVGGDGGITTDRSFPGRVEFGDNYDFAGTVSYSFELLLKPTIMDASHAYVFTKEPAGSLGGYNLDIWDAGIVSRRFDSAGANDGAFTATPLVANTKYHIVVTYDGANIKIYKNGVEIATQPSTRLIAGSTALLTMGSFTGGSDGLSGVLDEFAVYDTALSAATILAHYNASEPTALVSNLDFTQFPKPKMVGGGDG